MGDILIAAIDETIREQKYIHTQLLCHHIFTYIVTYHQAFFRRNIQLLQNASVIFKVGFAVAGIFVGV